MTTTYTTLLGYALPETGTLEGLWGDEVNNSITQLVEDSVANYATADVTSGNWTLSTTGTGLSNEARMAILIPTGTPGVSRNIIAPAHSKIYVVVNQSDSAVVVKGASTTGATIGAGYTAVVVWNGSDFEEISPTLAKYAIDLIGGVQGSVPYQSAANTTTLLAPGTSGQVLISGGAGANPSWGVPSNLAGGVQGSVPYQSATNVTTLLAPGTSGQVLISGGTGANPSWGVPSNLAGGVQGSVPYQSATNVTTLLAPGTAGKVLTTQGAGAAPTWETPTSELPSQSGHAGQFLTTDGTNASWSATGGGGISAGQSIAFDLVFSI